MSEPSLNSEEFASHITRRAFLGRAGVGLGSVALASMMHPARGATATVASGPVRGALLPTNFPIRAKRVIHLCMAGGPSHLETFDPKPELKRLHGQPFPESFTRGQQLAQLQNTQLKAFGPIADFKKYGKSGQDISDLLP